MKTGAQGEAFTRNTLCFKRLCVNQREHRQGEAFTRNTLKLNILQANGEEVKAKIGKRRMRARHAYALGGRRALTCAPREQGAKKRPSAHRPPEKIL